MTNNIKVGDLVKLMTDDSSAGIMEVKRISKRSIKRKDPKAELDVNYKKEHWVKRMMHALSFRERKNIRSIPVRYLRKLTWMERQLLERSLEV